MSNAIQTIQEGPFETVFHDYGFDLEIDRVLRFSIPDVSGFHRLIFDLEDFHEFDGKTILILAYVEQSRTSVPFLLVNGKFHKSNNERNGKKYF